jgi:hypothetical protein
VKGRREQGSRVSRRVDPKIPGHSEDDVVGQVLANAWKFDLGHDSSGLQLCWVTNPREHEDLRSSIGTS